MDDPKRQLCNSIFSSTRCKCEICTSISVMSFCICSRKGPTSMIQDGSLDVEPPIGFMPLVKLPSLLIISGVKGISNKTKHYDTSALEKSAVKPLRTARVKRKKLFTSVIRRGVAKGVDFSAVRKGMLPVQPVHRQLLQPFRECVIRFSLQVVDEFFSIDVQSAAFDLAGNYRQSYVHCAMHFAFVDFLRSLSVCQNTLFQDEIPLKTVSVKNTRFYSYY